MTEGIEVLASALRVWAAQQPGILAIAIVGSHARGVARPDSDVDVIAIVDEPELYLKSPAWVERFGGVRRISKEDWGLVQSIRVHYAGGTEVEFGITVREWAGIDPLDPGTEKVVSNGMRLLYDPHALLEPLLLKMRAADPHIPL